MTSIKILLLAPLLVTHENTTVNEGTGHQDFTAGTSDDNLMTNEDTVNVTTLERCFNERIDREILTL